MPRHLDQLLSQHFPNQFKNNKTIGRPACQRWLKPVPADPKLSGIFQKPPQGGFLFVRAAAERQADLQALVCRVIASLLLTGRMVCQLFEASALASPQRSQRRKLRTTKKLKKSRKRPFSSIKSDSSPIKMGANSYIFNSTSSAVTSCRQRV